MFDEVIQEAKEGFRTCRYFRPLSWIVAMDVETLVVWNAGKLLLSDALPIPESLPD